MKLAILLTVTLALALAIPAGAEHCSIEDGDPEVVTPATGVSVTAREVGGENPGVYYVDTSICQPQCLFDVWIYEETNGHPGLQRGDEFADECQYLEADTILF